MRPWALTLGTPLVAAAEELYLLSFPTACRLLAKPLLENRDSDSRSKLDADIIEDLCFPKILTGRINSTCDCISSSCLEHAYFRMQLQVRN